MLYADGPYIFDALLHIYLKAILVKYSRALIMSMFPECTNVPMEFRVVMLGRSSC